MTRFLLIITALFIAPAVLHAADGAGSATRPARKASAPRQILFYLDVGEGMAGHLEHAKKLIASEVDELNSNDTYMIVTFGANEKHSALSKGWVSAGIDGRKEAREELSRVTQVAGVSGPTVAFKEYSSQANVTEAWIVSGGVFPEPYQLLHTKTPPTRYPVHVYSYAAKDAAGEKWLKQIAVRFGGEYHHVEDPSAPAAQPLMAVSPDVPSVVFVCVAGGTLFPSTEVCKSALRAGIESLSTRQKFNLIILSMDKQLDMLAKEPVAATPENLKKCSELIDKLKARGGSNTEIPLQAALQQHPAVIYLVAAAASDSTKADSIAVARKLNANRRTKINAFAWGDDETIASLMRDLAKVSGGDYRAVTNDELRVGLIDRPAQPATLPAKKTVQNKLK